MDLPDNVRGAIAQAVIPSGRDEVEASAVLLEVLSDGSSHLEREIFAELATRRGLNPDEELPLVVTYAEGRWPEPDPEHTALARERLRVATRHALVRLVAEGLVVQASGDVYREHGHGRVPLELHMMNTTTKSSLDVSPGIPTLGGEPANSRWMLLDDAAHPRVVLARTELADGLEDLLGQRGHEVLLQAIACFRRGLYIAAADLLAASSEAAWFTLGRLIPEADDRQLFRLARGGADAANVINRAADAVARLKILPTQSLNDIRAQAAHFRDIRNYGVHPTGDRDLDREDAFTEVGCATLFMSARRYFARLEQARLALLQRRNGGSGATASPEAD